MTVCTFRDGTKDPTLESADDAFHDSSHEKGHSCPANFGKGRGLLQPSSTRRCLFYGARHKECDAFTVGRLLRFLGTQAERRNVRSDGMLKGRFTTDGLYHSSWDSIEPFPMDAEHLLKCAQHLVDHSNVSCEKLMSHIHDCGSID